MVIETANLSWQWPGEGATLQFPDIRLSTGDHLFVRGPSGSGKSTLLSLLSGLKRAKDGQVEVHGHDMKRLSGSARDQLRADFTGVIFQQFNLVPYLTALDNVTLPCRLSSVRRQRAKQPEQSARHLLQALGLPQDSWQRKPAALSTGQQQRVAAARALIGAPPLILADEPTSALDTDNRDRFIALLLARAADHGTSVVFVSHDPSLAVHFPHQLELTTGREAQS